MAAADFAASIAALVGGEVLSAKLSSHFVNHTIRDLQKKIAAGIVDASFPGTLRDRVARCIATATGVPTLYLTILALRSVPRLSRWLGSGLGYGAAIAGTLLILAYGWERMPSKISATKVLYLSLPAFCLVVLNLGGLIALNV